MEYPKEDIEYSIAKRNRIYDLIGDRLHYGRCRCGKSWWYAKKNNPGIYLGNGMGKIMCNECYIKDRPRIDSVSRERMGEERWIYPVEGEDDLEVAPPIGLWRPSDSGE